MEEFPRQLARVKYLAPFWPLILADRGLAIAFHLGPRARSRCRHDLRRRADRRVSDLGRRVDLVDRSVRHGEGDPELARALRSDAEGDWG